MGNYDSQCTGQYTKYYIIDRANFMQKIQEGMSIEEYWEIQKNTRKIYVSIGTQNVRCPFMSYRFVVNGKTYYGTSKIGYSRDIHARMAGKPCKVYFQSNNPYLSSPGDINSNTSDDTAQPLSIASMVTGILSLCISCIPFFSIVIGGLSLALGIFALQKKKTNNIFAWAGTICSGIAILIGLIVILLFISIYVFDFSALL